MQTILKYNKQLRTIGEYFGGHMKSSMLMTTKFGVVFVNMKTFVKFRTALVMTMTTLAEVVMIMTVGWLK